MQAAQVKQGQTGLRARQTPQRSLIQALTHKYEQFLLLTDSSSYQVARAIFEMNGRLERAQAVQFDLRLQQEREIAARAPELQEIPRLQE